MEKGKAQQKHVDKLRSFGIEIDDSSEIELLQYHKGEMIIREGFPMENLLFVLSGKAKICASADNGRDLLLSYYIDGGIVGDVELMINEYIASTTMIALTEFECIALPYKKWSVKLKTNTIFLNRIGRELAVKLLQCTSKNVETALHDGEKRLCTYIFQAAVNDIFEEPLTNVASAIGLSYRQMLRIMKVLCEENILLKEEKYYRIIDRKALQKKGFL